MVMVVRSPELRTTGGGTDSGVAPGHMVVAGGGSGRSFDIRGVLKTAACFEEVVKGGSASLRWRRRRKAEAAMGDEGAFAGTPKIELKRREGFDAGMRVQGAPGG